jgi:ankyrin repeat protein
LFGNCSASADRGAEVSSRDNTDKTPLFYAAQLSNVELLQTLLLRGAGADDKDSVGRTPLSYAVSSDPQNSWGVHEVCFENF